MRNRDVGNISRQASNRDGNTLYLFSLFRAFSRLYHQSKVAPGNGPIMEKQRFRRQVSNRNQSTQMLGK